MKKIIILSIILSMFLIGCNGTDDVTGPEPYIGGSRGVIAEFEPLGLEEDGLFTIYDDEEFPLQLILKNKGEEPIASNQAKVQIYGILLDDFESLGAGELTNEREIGEVSEVNSEGGEEIINFGQKLKYLPEIQGGFYDANIFAAFTYRYKTHASVPKVCFKEDFTDDEVCDVDERKTVFSSGAPIQVKSVIEKPAGAGIISLTFEVENVGGGESTLPASEFNNRYSQFQYTITPSAEVVKWRCTAAGRENQARFNDGRATIICKLNDPLEEGAKYTRQIGLELEYDYFLIKLNNK